MYIRLTFCFFIFLLFSPGGLFAQRGKKGEIPPSDKPRLVLGIVVEQFRPEYIVRYWDKFQDDGFKRLVNNGTNCTNVHFDQLIQKPSVGTATIFTGVNPSFHGIISNQWLNRLKSEIIPCTYDENYMSMGCNVVDGHCAPTHLLATTLGDQMKLMYNGRCKVYGVALNDPAAIFSAGHAANGAFWLEEETGNMISSSYYFRKFPEWVSTFNEKRLPDLYLSKKWTTLLPLNSYEESLEDDYLLERGYWDRWNTFPHDLEKYYKKAGSYKILKDTPFGNSLVKDFAISLIEQEAIGMDNVPDLLSVVFSSLNDANDLFGPTSVEMEDLYLRLDQDIAHLLNYIDHYIGLENTLVFLTSNCSSSYSVDYMIEEMRLPAGIFKPLNAIALLKSYLNIAYGEGKWVKDYLDQQIYLNHELIEQRNVSLEEIQKKTTAFITQFQGVVFAKPACELEITSYSDGYLSAFQSSYFKKRSGDILIGLQQGWKPEIQYQTISYTENKHIPLIWYGWDIPKNKITRKLSVTDIVPSICEMLRIPAPDFSKGTPLFKIN